jgi:hypothetical protein
MIAAPSSHIPGEYLPDAAVRIYPDERHNFLFQLAEKFAARVTEFLGWFVGRLPWRDYHDDRRTKLPLSRAARAGVTRRPPL